MLGTLLKGKLLRSVMLTSETNGHEAHRLILRETAPHDRARSLALLHELVATSGFRQETCMGDLRAFEEKVSEYEAASG